MSVLMLRPIELISLIALLALGGCHRASPDYKQMKKLPYSEWDRFARTLPIARRLDLHKELAGHSGHNPDMTLSESFDGEPAATYRELMKRIEHGDKDRDYIPVIYAINRTSAFDMCVQPDRKIMQDFLWTNATEEVANANRPRFYYC